MIEVRTPVNQFFDNDGSPLDAGYIYIGTTGANPETNPQTVYWDKAGTIPAAQPLRTLNGYPSRDGAVSKFYTATKNYSITVKDKRSVLVMGVLNSDSGVFDELSETSGASAVGYDNAASGLAATDVQAAIDEVQTNIETVEAQIDALSSSFSGVINLFANSAFLINARAYVSGAATTGANQYTLDRIRVVVSGQSLTFTAATFGNRITAPAGGAEQVIEGGRIVGGDYACTWTGTGTITVDGVVKAKGESFTLTANTNTTIHMVGEFEKFMLTRPEMIGRYEYNQPEDVIVCRRHARLNGCLSGWSTSTTALNALAVDFSSNPMFSSPAITLVDGTGKGHDPGVVLRNVSAPAYTGNAFGGYVNCTIAATTANKLHNLLPGTVLFTAEL